MSNLENSNDAIDQSTFLETNKLKPKTMQDLVDAVEVVQELPQSPAEPQADFSRPDGNALPEAEILAAKDIETLSSDIAEADGVICRPSSDQCTEDLETENEDLLAVIIYPDHMVYRDSYCTDCVLTFTSSCVKLEGSILDADIKTFKFQWGVQDISHIKSHWYGMVGMAMVIIHVLAEGTVQAEDAACISGVELKFVVIDTNWYGRQEAITSLNATYKSLWSSMLATEDDVQGHTQASFTNYFPNFDQPFEEVIYPKGDVDAVSISKRDVDLLLPDTFVNDTIIDFYIKYLKNRIKPEERHRFYFFNSFFFRKLADLDKDPLDASEGKAAFQRVRKWTRKVNLFEKDYVFIPVNYNYHWSLIVMCHLGEMTSYKDEDATEFIKVPCVLHMDSIRGSHTGLKGLIQSYLKEEWKARLQEASEDISSRFDNLRFISLELPQQPNSFDCGLFLLHYVELFLDQAPINFNPFKITKSVNFLNVDWFPPADASLKRVVIQRLVYDLLQQPYHEPPPMAANDEHCSLSSPKTNIHKGTAVNFFSEMSNPSTACRNSQDDRGIEITLLPSLSLTSEPYPEDPGAFLGMNFPSFNQTTFDEYKNSLVPPIEENVETGGQFVYSSTEIGLGQSNGIVAEDFKSNGFETASEVINGNEQPLMERVEILDDTNERTFALCRADGPTGFDELSGFESDVQHPTKRMRMAEPPPEGD